MVPGSLIELIVYFKLLAVPLFIKGGEGARGVKLRV